ncbi:MAG: insulinase family protein [Muribaculaceae bacterium]|nr:insulinase family protein [Muribaculaceae bacterium]
MKRLTSLATLILMFVVAFAQQMPITPLPLKSEVKTGVLPNGLTYYILHNEQPKERANFYIAQKVGSALENQDQLGLAHFLEHMAFNGITHYPGKAMLNYLQSKGIRFGADINAYTGFDETVYNINNVITTDKPLMDSVLLVIRDWCDGILLEESEIDAERGVINEEWRSRNDVGTRMYTTILPQIFKEYQYQQMPIGKMEVVMNFKPEVLRAYYKKWYRPDQQGIVIVGDFDAEEMEKKVKDLFSTVKMPEDAAPREYVDISDNKEPIFVLFQDPELDRTIVQTYFKQDKMPWEMRNSVEGYMSDAIMKNIFIDMLQNRISEYALDPQCPYAGAQVRLGEFLVAATKDAFEITVVPKDDVLSAYNAAMGVVARACKTGFSSSELERANAELLNTLEKTFNEKDKTYSETYGRELIRHFIDNEATPGIEVELQLAKQIIPMLPVEAYNQIGQQLLTAENQVIVVNQPLKDNITPMKEDEMIAALEGTINAEYEAYVDEVITEPLIAKLPKKGSIKSSSDNPLMGTTEFTLSNGVKVILKNTDFKADEIRVVAFRNGGKQMYSKAQAADVLMINDAVELSKLGNFDVNTMRKYLAGKTVSLGYAVNGYTDVLEGNSSVKDFNTLAEVIYAYFTELNPDETTYQSQIDKIIPIYEAQSKLPNTIFGKRLSKAVYGDNPLMMPVDVEVLKQANYGNMLSMAKKSLENAADYTFIFVGNIDEATLRPVLEQYIASLPSKGKATSAKVLTDLKPVSGKVEDKFDQSMESPVTQVFNLYSGSNLKWDVKNGIMVDLMGEVLDMIFIETLREDEGGTYGASVGSGFNYQTNLWQLQYFYQTAEEKLERLEARAEKELNDLLKNGAKADHFNKVKEAAIKQYEINSKTNSYWTGCIMNAERGANTHEGYIEALQSLTLDDFNKFLKNVYDGKNEIEVIMVGKPAAE